MTDREQPDERVPPAADVVSRIGSMNHIRLTVTDIAKARRFYDPLLGFMGYRLVEQSAAGLPGPR